MQRIRRLSGEELTDMAVGLPSVWNDADRNADGKHAFCDDGRSAALDRFAVQIMSVTIMAIQGYEKITGLTPIGVTTARFELNIVGPEKSSLWNQLSQTHAPSALERWLHVLGLLAFGSRLGSDV